MKTSETCSLQAEDSNEGFPNCANKAEEEDLAQHQEEAFFDPGKAPKGIKRNLLLLLWVLFPPIMLIVSLTKSRNLDKKEKTAWSILAAVIALSFVLLLLLKKAPDDKIIPENVVTGAFTGEEYDNAPKNVDSFVAAQTSGETPLTENNDTQETAETAVNSGQEPNQAVEMPKEVNLLSIESVGNSSIWDTEVGGTKEFSYDILPFEATIEDIKIVSTNPIVADITRVSPDEKEGKKCVSITVSAKSAGKTSLIVTSKDGSVPGGELKITVKEKPQPAPQNTNTVYVTPTGKKYHFSARCGGKNSTETTLDEAKNAGLTPCAKCAK